MGVKKRTLGLALGLVLTASLGWYLSTMFMGSSQHPAYVVFHAGNLAPDHEKLFGQVQFQFVDLRHERSSVTRELLEAELEPEEYVQTYGPLAGPARDEVNETLELCIRSSQKSLFDMQRELENNTTIDLEREGLVLQVLARELVEKRLFSENRYMTIERGNNAFVWPPPGFVTSRYPVVIPHQGKAVDVVFLISKSEFPELQQAEIDLKDRQQFVAQEAAYRFNSLNDEQRKNHFDIYSALKKERKRPETEEELAVWKTLLPMLLYGAQFDSQRYLIYVE